MDLDGADLNGADLSGAVDGATDDYADLGGGAALGAGSQRRWLIPSSAHGNVSHLGAEVLPPRVGHLNVQSKRY